MGLDQYLSKKTYVKYWEHNGDHNFTITVTRNGKPVDYIDGRKISYIEEEVGYWRKANHIHNWFVENVQSGSDDCREYVVSEERLAELLDICKEVLEDPTKGEQLLPTTPGFFFGSTDYDEWYIKDIQHTIEVLESVLESIKVSKENKVYSDIYYSSSW
jgi:hypothetical protein